MSEEPTPAVLVLPVRETAEGYLLIESSGLVTGWVATVPRPETGEEVTALVIPLALRRLNIPSE